MKRESPSLVRAASWQPVVFGLWQADIGCQERNVSDGIRRAGGYCCRCNRRIFLEFFSFHPIEPIPSCLCPARSHVGSVRSLECYVSLSVFAPGCCCHSWLGVVVILPAGKYQIPYMSMSPSVIFSRFYCLVKCRCSCVCFFVLYGSLFLL